jgi:hypothetical protein
VGVCFAYTLNPRQRYHLTSTPEKYIEYFVTAFNMSNSVGNADVADSLHVRRHALRDEFGKELLQDYSGDEGHHQG